MTRLPPWPVTHDGGEHSRRQMAQFYQAQVSLKCKRCRLVFAGLHGAVVQTLQDAHARCLFCLRGKMCSSPKRCEGREADLVSCSTGRTLSCSSCWRGLCHIQLSKCARQQSPLVMRATGREWFRTSSPETLPAGARGRSAWRRAPVLLGGSGLWFSQTLLSIKTALAA